MLYLQFCWTLCATVLLDVAVKVVFEGHEHMGVDVRLNFDLSCTF